MNKRPLNFAMRHKKKILTLVVALCVALWRACS